MDFLVLFSVFLRQKVNMDGNVSITDHAPEMWLLVFSGLAINRKTGNDVTICRHDISSKFFDIDVFFLSSLVTGPSFLSILSLVLEL